MKTPMPSPAGRVRFLVTLIFLVGLAMATAAGVQLALRADAPAEKLSLTIQSISIIDNNNDEILRIRYQASTFGPQTDKSRVSLVFLITADDKNEQRLLEDQNDGKVDYRLGHPAFTQAINIKVAGSLYKVGRDSNLTNESVQDEISSSKAALRTRTVTSDARPKPKPSADPMPAKANPGSAPAPIINEKPPPVPQVDLDEKPAKALAPTEFGPVENLGQYATKIMGYALPLGMALAVIMTIYAGILFMVSQGQPDRIKDAQEIIQGAILGLAVLIMARFLVNFLILPSIAPVDSNPIVGAEEQTS